MFLFAGAQVLEVVESVGGRENEGTGVAEGMGNAFGEFEGGEDGGGFAGGDAFDGGEVGESDGEEFNFRVFGKDSAGDVEG